MSQEVAGLAILTLMFVSMGGVGLYVSWPNLKRAVQERH